jgi:UPF0716 protein FxsA
MVKWFIAAILLLPLAEIATFVVVALFIGWGWAFLLTALTTVVGFVLLRQGGRGPLAGLRRGEIDAGAGNLLPVLGGILLLLPGFLTDLAGALLLVPPVRRALMAWIRRAMPSQTGDPRVIDLEPDEWQQVPEPKRRRQKRLDRS